MDDEDEDEDDDSGRTEVWNDNGPTETSIRSTSEGNSWCDRLVDMEESMKRKERIDLWYNEEGGEVEDDEEEEVTEEGVTESLTYDDTETFDILKSTNLATSAKVG